MVSLVDALFIMPTALFAVGFIVPALVMSTGAGQEFKHATSIGMSETVAQSFAMAFLESRINNKTNLRQSALVMSGQQRSMNWALLEDQPEMFSYLKVKFDSPATNPSKCSAGGFFSRKTSYGGPCDFYLKSFGAKKINKETKHFRVPVPIRGGKQGVMDLVYQVR
ncbi:MAG: hypothetical protein ABEK10_02975 [Candidatus Nanosalina sp.]